MIGRLTIMLALAAAPVGALELSQQGAVMTRTESTPAGSVRLPDGPWTTGVDPPQIEGAIRRQSYRLSGGARTTLQLITPIRERLEADGYETVFSCADAACGGFDFRFQLDILGEPDMHVDLGDFRYLLMRRDGSADPHTISVVASRSQTSGFVHITEVSDAEQSEPESPTEVSPEVIVETTSGMMAQLESKGSVVLDDLVFESGAGELGAGQFDSLTTLAGWLSETPSARIILVGHTDAVGSLAANTNLSRQRAQSVAARLVAEYGVNAAQIQAEGAGYLAPRDSNLTPEGRAQNRRVEVVLLSRE